MAKITLFPLYALLMIFALFWNHGNATTPRKLGVRHNAVTSLPNTNEAVDSRESMLHFLPFSSSPSQTNVIIPRKQGEGIPFRQLSADIDEKTTRTITGRSSSSNMWKPVQLEVTPRKLEARHNAVTSLPTANGATTRKLGKRQNPIIITSSANTNEATDSHESGLHFSAISSSPIQTNVIIPREQGEDTFHQLSTDIDDTTARKIASRSSSSNMWQHVHFEVTPRKLGARGNVVASLPNTNEATARKRQNPIIITSSPNTNEAVDSRELVLHFLPISSSPTQTNMIIPRNQGDDRFHQLSTDIDGTTTRTITGRSSSSNMWKPVQLEVTPRKLEARHNAVTSLPNANEATPRKPGKRQNPIIITSSPNTNEEVDSRESVLHFLPISSSPTQTNIVIPSEPGMGHGSSIHQLSTDADETTTRKIKNRFSSSQVLEPIRYFEGNSHN